METIKLFLSIVTAGAIGFASIPDKHDAPAESATTLVTDWPASDVVATPAVAVESVAATEPTESEELKAIRSLTPQINQLSNDMFARIAESKDDIEEVRKESRNAVNNLVPKMKTVYQYAIDTNGQASANKDSIENLTTTYNKYIAESQTCECDCPSIDKIREVIKEELDKAIKGKTFASSSSTSTKSGVVSSTPVSSRMIMSQPYVSSVSYGSTYSDGNCSPTTTYYPQSQPVYQNQPRTTYGGAFGGMRTLSSPSSGSCRIVNGRQVCN